MKHRVKIEVIILALNEEASIGQVMRQVPREWVHRIIVVDNGSVDRTAEVADRAGAFVVREEKRGYGHACLQGMAALSPDCDVVVFLDGDASDHGEQLQRLVEPIVNDQADFVLGSRVKGRCEPGALTPQQRFGNWLATRLLRGLYGFEYSDLGPFRAIRKSALASLNMSEKTFGWTVEMQIKALKKKLRVQEVPVDYRRRIGKSKISGTLKGTVQAGACILWTIAKSTVR